MSPFIVPSLKKIVGANLEKIDKVDFRDIQTYRQTYYSDLIGPFPSGVQKKFQIRYGWDQYHGKCHGHATISTVYYSHFFGEGGGIILRLRGLPWNLLIIWISLTIYRMGPCQCCIDSDFIWCFLAKWYNLIWIFYFSHWEWIEMHMATWWFLLI